MEKIVVLDGHALNPGDLDWAILAENKGRQFAELTVFDRSTPEEVVVRAREATVVVINKIKMTDEVMARLPRLRLIAITATGTDNIDREAAKKRNIAVRNVTGYSSHSVAQHVFAMILSLTNQAEAHNETVKKGQWSHSPDFSYFLRPWHELAGKTLGIFGFGNIGRKVASIGLGFGMRVLAYNRSGNDYGMDVAMTHFDALIAESDFLSLHAPLTPATKQLFSAGVFQKMKPTAYLINTARGGLIHEPDLAQALKNQQIAGAALDVLSQEPPPEDHVLLHLPNCLITPHMAWTSIEARTTLLRRTAENIREVLGIG